jgi:SpoIID/LytB domain protein
MPQYAQHILRLRGFTTSHWGRACTTLTVCALVVWSGTTKKLNFGGSPPETQIAAENQADLALQRAATNALGQRAGTVIVMDPQTGRVRAVVNPDLAFENSFAPGSTVKPFVALAALRDGLIDQNSRTLCREHYSHKDFAIVCAHPRDLPPLSPAQAVAYSCNYYFGTLGERLDEERLSETLRSFGLGRPTGVGDKNEATGTLLRGKPDPRNTLGEGGYLQVTPIQLLTAYSALVNGGHLFTPGVAQATDFRVTRRSQLQIAPEHRAIVIEGMRGAIRFGTAKNSGLDLPALYIFGKTGTSTPTSGFHSQGWFVGFAADPVTDGEPPSDKVRLAVLVFLKRAHGADAAALAHSVFEEYRRERNGESGGLGDTETRGLGDTGTLSVDPSGSGSDAYFSHHLRVPVLPNTISVSPRLRVTVSGIKVHLVRENITKQISLEEYVAGVVATEGSMEGQPEALKALAVAARSYALKNLGRHARDGYDFCTMTHCQRFVSTANAIGSGAQAMTNRRALDAVRATTGLVLRDERGQPADAYFSASCGGATANIQTLWGITAPSYLRGVADEYCATMPHHSWTDVISVAELWQALRSDPRTDPGARLDDVNVAQRDATGRAETIAIEGQYRRTVNGWDFKIIVGRSLGWNKLKSSRFEIARSGSDFVFRGSGFGHGLGLCQEGAHVLAQQGASYQQILAKYFPGASVAGGREGQTAKRVDMETGRRGGTESKQVSTSLAMNRLIAAPPHPSAVRLCLLADEASFNKDGNGSQRHRLSALASGRAAKDGEQERLFADVLWSPPTRHRNRSAAGAQGSYNAESTRLLPVAPSPHLPVPPAPRLSISSEHFRISYSAHVPRRDAERILQTLESTRMNLLHRISSAGLSISGPATLDIFVNETTGDFVGRTGQPWWAAAATRGTHVELQPIQLLQRRGVLVTTLRHELAHAVIDSVGRGRTPRWLAEGMALFFAGEGPLITRYTPRARMTVDQIDRKLGGAGTADEMRSAYAAAYREVSNLIQSEGESSIWRRVVGG